MKTKQLALFLFVISVLSLEAQNNSLVWQNGLIIIDGNISDWNGNLKNFDQNTGIKYEFRNDSTNLYIAYEIPEQKVQMRALMTGILIEITAKSKSKVKASIKLPIIDRRSMGRNDSHGLDFTGIKNSYLMGNYHIDVTGFKYSTGLIFPKQVSEMISFGYRWNETNNLAYELKIPFKDLFDTNYNLSPIATYNIVVKTKLLALQAPSGSSQGEKGGAQGGGSGMRSGGGGGRKGGMGGGGNQGGMQPSGERQGRSGVSQEVSFVEKFTLPSFNAK